jgi:hypothetical protein
VPFVIGALREPAGQPFETEIQAFQCLKSLLSRLQTEVREREFDNVKIFRCPDLQQPVVTLSTNHSYPSYEAWGVPRPITGRLLIDPPYQPLNPGSLYAAAELLWSAVSQPIVSGKFAYSRTTKSYCPFDDEDRRFIAQALAFDEDDQL